MLKKSRINVLLVLSILLTSIVPHGVHAETWAKHQTTSPKYKEERLSKIFNKFRYEMTVEWDQHDPYFKENAEKELEISLIALKS